MTKKLRSSCPINYCLEQFGDTWSLVIVRDIVFNGKSTFGDFMDSAEGVSSKLLSNRLGRLVENSILGKQRDAQNGRIFRYSLTPKGKELVPILHAMIVWGAEHGSHNPELLAWAQELRQDPIGANQRKIQALR